MKTDARATCKNISDCVLKEFANLRTRTSCNTPWQWSMNVSLSREDYAPCTTVPEYLQNHYGIQEIIYSEKLLEMCLGELLENSWCMCCSVIEVF